MNPQSFDWTLTIVFVTMLILILLIFAVLLFTRFRKKSIAHLLEKQHMEFEFRQTLLASQLEIHQQTLKTISREIHDNIGQVLSLAKLHLNTTNLDDRLDAEEKITSAKNLVSGSILNLRDLSRTLHPRWISEVGLARAIEEELKTLEKTGALRTTISTRGFTGRLDVSRQLILFRMVQECLQNTIKHAKARNLSVRIQEDHQDLEVSVEDDGSGFSAEDIHEGAGLRNLHERAELLGGTLGIRSATDEGTAITIRVPVNSTSWQQ